MKRQAHGPGSVPAGAKVAALMLLLLQLLLLLLELLLLLLNLLSLVLVLLIPVLLLVGPTNCTGRQYAAVKQTIENLQRETKWR